MNPYAIHAGSIQSLIDEMGDDCPAFTWGGNDYSILPGTAKTRKDLTVGGFSLDFDLQFVALVSPFVAGAITGATTLRDAMLETEMQYLSDNYKIVSVDIVAGGQQVRIGANSLSQGA